MNAFQLKILAIVTMIIGRIAFPLFAWLIANGAYHTQDIKRYLLRLYFFSLLAQLPFLLANRVVDPNFSELNVLCTLFLGLAAITVMQKSTNIVLRIATVAICFITAQLLQTDYGGFGVLSVICFYFFFNNFSQLVVGQVILFVAQFIFVEPNFYTISSLLSLIFIYFYNDKAGFRLKYLFYLFYPLQYVVYFFLIRGLHL